MKKLNLTVPKPCHENWEHMRPEDKGRFCGSCQKTVVDFTAMSDRELAAFFKKPAGSVCGRFHNDQLNRDIVVQKKRIPWIKYFFHIAWPAFIVMLKSCGPKDRVTGKVISTQSLTKNSEKEGLYEYATMGAVLTPGIIPEDSIAERPPAVSEAAVKEECRRVKRITSDELVLPSEQNVKKDSVVRWDANAFENKTVEWNSLAGSVGLVNIRMGGVSFGEPVKSEKEPVGITEVNNESQLANRFITYPNPVRTGGTLNIKLNDPSANLVSIQLLTASGARVLHKTVNESTLSAVIPLPLPANLAAGVYFVQIQYDNGDLKKSTILVTK